MSSPSLRRARCGASRGHARWALLALLWGLLPTLAQAQGTAILPLAEVRPGMTGYGLTVFSGTKPERFAVRVIGVLRQYIPTMDIILIESDDPRVVHSGIAAGMSGSPIYLEGKLAGALAYGWIFSKDPVGGVTPIEYMQRELRRPLAPATPPSPHASSILTPQGLPPHLAPLATGEARLVPAAVPLSVAGLSERAIAGLREALGPYGIVPMQASGGRSPGRRGPDSFEPGGVIAVELIRGDLNATGTGTVTFIEGTRVAAFGHQMFNAGELQLPIATGEIITVLASQLSSMKLSAPLEEKGMLVLDRQACIVGDMARRTTMVPMNVTVHTLKPGSTPVVTEQVYRTEIANHRLLTPMLAQSVISSALQTGAPDVTDAVVEIRSRLLVRGYAPLEQTDHLYSPAGAVDKLIGLSTGFKQLHELLGNSFAPVQIDGFDLRIDVTYRADVAEILGATVSGDELEPDTRPSLNVTLRPYGGAPYVRAIPFDVPRWLAGQTLKIEVSAGHLVKPELAPPENLADLIENLRKSYSARTLVVTLTTADEGVTLRGHLVPNLPASVIATLRPSGGSKRVEPYKRVSRLMLDMGTVLNGKQELTVLVRDETR